MTGATPTLEMRQADTQRLWNLAASATAPRTPEEWVRSVDGRLRHLSRQARALRRWIWVGILVTLATGRLGAEEFKTLLLVLKGIAP